MAWSIVLLRALSDQRRPWTSRPVAVILQSWFGIFSNWSDTQQMIFGLTNLNAEDVPAKSPHPNILNSENVVYWPRRRSAAMSAITPLFGERRLGPDIAEPT